MVDVNNILYTFLILQFTECIADKPNMGSCDSYAGTCGYFPIIPSFYRIKF